MSVTDDRAFTTSGNISAADEGESKGKSLDKRGSVGLAEELAELRIRVAAQPELVELRRQVLPEKELKRESRLTSHERALVRGQRRRRARAASRRAWAEDRQARKIENLKAREQLKQAYADADMNRWRDRAAAQSERLTSHDIKTAQLARQLAWTKRTLVALVAIGMAWSGVNVQHNLVPSNDMSEPLYWIAYGIDGMLLGGLLVLMLTSATMSRWQQVDERTAGRLGRFGGYALELVLTLVSLGLNTIPQIAHGNLGKAFEYMVPPLAVAVLLWVYNWSTRSLSLTLVAATKPKPTFALSETNLVLLGQAQRAFALLEEGVLQPSTAPDGCGVPAGGQLATHLKVSKPIANSIRDLMKAIVRGDLQIAGPGLDQAPSTQVTLLRAAQ
ncbi:hypothetical protein [Amycolatopsis sp. NPDC059657]|uniref:hypothetical protein n=1 Tax=Amycolatopsis sp. NPDC059657 TaxID=3346899 RepID=UPI0036704E06